MSSACYIRATAFYEIHQNCAESFLWESSKLCDVPLMRGPVTVARGLLSNIPGIVQRWPLTLPPSTTIITFQGSCHQHIGQSSNRAELGNAEADLVETLEAAAEEDFGGFVLLPEDDSPSPLASFDGR